MRILITGVSSFLGKETAKELLARGHQVIGILRPTSKNKEGLQVPGLEGLQLISMDFDELPRPDRARYHESFSSEVSGEGTSIDAWIHYSWDGIGSQGRQDPEIQKRNIENGKKAYLMAEAMGVRSFLFAGSQAEYGSGSHEKPEPVSAYGKAKRDFGNWGRTQSFQRKGEWRRSGKQGAEPMRFYHLRIHSVYGPGDHPTTLTNAVAEACREGGELSLGPCTQSWNYMEIQDFRQAIALFAETERVETGIYDIASEDTRPLRDFVLEGAAAILQGMQDRDAAEGKDSSEAADPMGEAGLLPAESPGKRPWKENTVSAMLPGYARFRLHFGTRENNAEGDSGMHPEISRLLALGFRQQVSFRDGMLRLAGLQ